MSISTTTYNKFISIKATVNTTSFNNVWTQTLSTILMACIDVTQVCA
jgi:hypothetical protein